MGSADPPWKNGWKIKKRKHAKKNSFLCLCYILRAIRAGRCRERRYADPHIIYSDIGLLQNAPFRSQIFFASGGKEALIPLTKNHSDVSDNSFRVLFDKIASVYFIWKKIYLYFSVGGGQPREPAPCQLMYRHITLVRYIRRRNLRSCDTTPFQIRLVKRTLLQLIVYEKNKKQKKRRKRKKKK